MGWGLERVIVTCAVLRHNTEMVMCQNTGIMVLSDSK